ncbi:MAG: Ldh family oxidoreductase [Blautia sp.]|nr:Ldh family oxidoreductase [Blautia sp.]
MKTIKIEELKEFSKKALLWKGVSPEDAETTVNALVTTDMFGVLSHGTKNLYQYILKMEKGGLDPQAVPEVEAEGPAWALINGNAAIGMVSACKAMDLAIEKAKACGIGYVGVKNSCHFGAAGYYANRAAKAGLMGISMSNADPNMSIPNSCAVALGNNPFSFAAPLKNGKSVFLDIALSNVAALKVVMAKEKGISVPDSWLIDSEGKPTTDPSDFPGGSFLQPMAAHKGYGLAIMVEILASVLTGSGIMSDVTSWNLDLPAKNNAGHAFIAIDITKMMPAELFEKRMMRMITELKNAPKAKDAERILVPGEMEWEKYELAEKRGYIELTDAMAENMEKLSALTGIPVTVQDKPE